jgi:prolyl-tRNA synthetase
MTKVVLYQHIGMETATEEKKIKDLQKRPLDVSFDSVEEGSCILTGNSSGRRVLFAKAY